MRMLKGFCAALGLAALVTTASPISAQAAPATVTAYPTSTFTIGYGASYYNGTVTWYNRSVGVTGTFRAVGCRRVYGAVYAGNTRLDFRSSSTWCDTTGSASLPLKADQPGGADNADVYMTDASGNYLAGVTCYRGVSVCT